MRNRFFLSGVLAVIALALVAESAHAQRRGGGWGGGRGWGGGGWGGGNSWSVGIGDGGIGVSYGRGYGYPYGGYYGGYYGNRFGSYGSPYYGGYSYYSPGSYYYSSPSYAYGDTYYSTPSYAYSSPSYMYSSPSYSSGGVVYSDDSSMIRQTSYSAPAANTINLRVLVPDASARVWIENELMSIQGSERLFYSPPVDTGKSYNYTVKASWMENGKEVTREKTLDVKAGQEFIVNFNEAPSSSSSNNNQNNGNAPAPGRSSDTYRSDSNPSSPRPPEPGLLESDKPMEYTVVSAGNGTLVVTNTDGLNRQTFTVPSEATITLDGQTSMLSDLREGQRIRITSKGEGTNRSILKIEARAKKENP